MPKFLDAPQWYNSSGSLLYGVGCTTNTVGSGSMPVSSGNGTYKLRTVMINGDTSGSKSIVAPEGMASKNAIPVGQSAYKVDWLTPGSNPAVLAYSASAENTTWLAPDSSNNQVLKNGGNGALIWAGPINRYLHNINVDCTVSNITYHCIFQLILSYQQEINTFLLLCQQMNTYYGTNNYIPCGGYSGSGRSNANTLYAVRASSAGALLISYIIGDGSGGVSSVTASSGTVKDKTILISSTY